MGETWAVEEMFGHEPEAFTSAAWKDSDVQKYTSCVVLCGSFHIRWGTNTKGAEGEYLEQEELTGKRGNGKLSFVIWTRQISSEWLVGHMVCVGRGKGLPGFGGKTQTKEVRGKT